MNHLDQQVDQARTNEFIDAQIQMINANISEEEQQLFHQVTTHETFNIFEANGYKLLLQRLKNKFHQCTEKVEFTHV